MSVDKKAQNRRELVLAYKRVFSSEDGQKVLFDILRTSGVLRSSFPKTANANEMR